MKHALPVRAVAEESADTVACDFPAHFVSWHLMALPTRLAAFRETQPWLTGQLSSVTFRLGVDGFKSLFQPKRFHDFMLHMLDFRLCFHS